jgi:putative transposase
VIAAFHCTSRQIHKRRNIGGHDSEKYHTKLKQRLSGAYNQTAYAAGKTLLERTVVWFERLNPDATSSLRQGLENSLTMLSLGLTRILRKTLATTNPIEIA